MDSSGSSTSSTSSLSVSPRSHLVPTNSTNLALRSRLSATRLSATTPSAEGGGEAKSNNDSIYRGLFRKSVDRFLFRERVLEPIETLQPRTSPIEPYLYLVPEGLQRYYRPLPNLLRALVILVVTRTAFLSTRWTNVKGISFRLVRQFAGFLFKAVAWSLLAQMVLQDTLFVDTQPSRVTMKTLMKQYFLPTSLSKYQPITINPIAPQLDESQGTEPHQPFALGVHYLQYDNDEKDDSDTTNDNNKRSFGAMYFQHGFGASSLSWLPVLPTLAKQMNARVALGHDTVGFGFTDRPRDKRWYRPRQAARIAGAILEQEGSASETDNANNNAPVCLVGHSMGSRSTLRLATQLPADTPKLIILSSPALGLIAPQPPRAPPSSNPAARLASSVSNAISAKLVRPASRYLLRRIIGANGSWKKGLEGAWGEPKKLTEDSDVLRYSWPSIGYGWEEGILDFAGAQVLPADDELDDDVLLLRKVLEQPHTKVLIVLGSRDRVIPTRSVERFLELVGASPSDVPIVELEGLGHCAFEEDRETFCDAVEQLVKDHWDTGS